MKTFKKIIFLLIISSLFSGTLLQAQERKVSTLSEWKFQKGVSFGAQNNKFQDAQWETVKIPHTYSMDAITDLGYYQGQGWYRTQIAGNTYNQNERIYIRFEGVGQKCTVYLNGKRIGTHNGAYSAFCYELTNNWNYAGNNQLAVQTDNTTDYKIIPTKTNLFNIYGGIYRPVSMFATPAVNITPTHHASAGVFVETKSINEDKATIEVRAHVSNKSTLNKQTLELIISNQQGKVVLKEKQNITVAPGKTEIITTTIDIQNPELWEAKENPHLYTLSTRITTKESEDITKVQFGIRDAKVDANKGFILNGEKYRLNGVCRHQEWLKEGPALTHEHHKADMDLIEEMGATAIRLAHYQQADDMYQLADERGFVVWAEIPFVHDWSGRETGNAKQQLTELILQNYNHPSICFWGLWNEVRAWQGKDAGCIKTTEQLNVLAHQLDTSRPTTSASDRTVDAPMSLITDLQAWNKYYGWYYGEYSDLGPWLDKTHAENPEVKIAISEYGAGANVAHQDLSKSEKPSGNYFPEQDQTLCHEESWNALKDKDYIWGSFLWNMFDFSVNAWNRGGILNTNHKGLITFDRKTKKDAFYFYKANWSENPTLYIAELRNTERTEPLTEVKVYTNLTGKISLELNGKKIASQKLDSDLHILRFKSIELKEGKNTIIVKAKNGKEVIQHSAIWNLTVE